MMVIRFFSEPFWEQLGLTLIHFLWQGLAVAVPVAVCVRLLRLRPGNGRHTIYLVAFVAMTACPLLTFITIEKPAGMVFAPAERPVASGAPAAGAVVETPPSGDPVVKAGAPIKTSLADAAPAPAARRLEAWLPWAVAVWMLGVVVLSVRLLLGFVGMWRWRRDRQALPEELAGRVARLSEGLGMPQFSRVFLSPAVLQATAVGYLRPMVLLPAAVLTQMDPAMIEAVIAHELAHIRRLDLWVNLAQRIVETLLFYHPAVWWLSSRLRAEREFCCDEMAVAATGERLTYASALETAQRARLAAAQSPLALALGQGRRSTLSRVRHILGLPPAPSDSRFWLAGAIVVAILAILAMPVAALLTAQAEAKTIETDETRTFKLIEAAADGSILMNAIGNDIWDNADEFGYAYKNLTGNGSMIARVDALDSTPNAWAKAGVMIRETAAAGSKNAFMCISGGAGGGAAYQRRTEENGESTSDYLLPDGPYAPPCWVRIDRAGSAFSAFISADGDTWVPAGDTQTIEMGDRVLIGLAVTSHNPTMPTSATFSRVCFTGGVSGDWQMVEVGGLPRAAAKGDIAQIKALIARGADVNVRDGTGKTALSRAAEQGHLDVAKLLIEHGADVRAMDKLRGQTPLHVAAQAGRVETARLLIAAGADVNAKDYVRRTPLSYVEGRYRGREVAELLRKCGAESTASAADDEGLEGVKEFIARGRDVNAGNTWGYTILHGVCMEGYEKAAEFVIAKGADVNARNIMDVTPLHVAAGRGHRNVVELLLDKKADINARDSHGATPLWYAKNGVVFSFSTFGKFRKSSTALWNAENPGCKEIVELLRKQGAKEQAPVMSLHEAANAGLMEQVKSLASKGADVNAMDDRLAGTPLHLAAFSNQWQVIEFLIANGANVNAKNKWDRTPLHIAIDQGHTEIAELLRKHGAKVETSAETANLTPAKLLFESATSKLAIPETSLEIPEQIQPCAANLRKIHAAIKKYEKDKGKLPAWLSDLVPNYVSKEALLCPNDPKAQVTWPADPKLPCGYTYDFCMARAWARFGGAPTDGMTLRDRKMAQVKLFGDVAPLCMCRRDPRRQLNISVGGDVYLSGRAWEYTIMPDYKVGSELKQEY